MRSRTRQKQKTWYSKVTEDQVGINTIKKYSKPKMVKLVVADTAGTSEEIGAGLVPDYDRLMTSYRVLPVDEGYVFWIDLAPLLDDDGNLLLEKDNINPVVPPDYVLKRILSTQKGTVHRYGISKIGGNH